LIAFDLFCGVPRETGAQAVSQWTAAAAIQSDSPSAKCRRWQARVRVLLLAAYPSKLGMRLFHYHLIHRKQMGTARARVLAQRAEPSVLQRVPAE
jgi:hypothetical protein